MLRKATMDDFTFVHELYMHPEINPHLLYERQEKREFEPIYADLVARGIKYIFQVNDKAVGMIKMQPLQHRNGHIMYLSGVAIHPLQWGHGYGVQMLQEALKWAKSEGFHRVELSVGSKNIAAKNLYLRLGFEHEGVMKDYSFLKSENRYIDEDLMSYMVVKS
jgi:putative acetyltransferase